MSVSPCSLHPTAARLLADTEHSTDGTGQPGYEFAFLFSFVYERRPIPLEQLAKVACPVLILRGGADNLVCPEAAWEKWQRCACSCSLT